ncbi:MAG: iron ABC transporter permease [Anaerolineales bacterium]|nr:iron ABC transporter permease [Anaerolineales bacterium]
MLFSVTLGVMLGPVSIPAHVVWRVAAYKVGFIPPGDWSSGVENIVWLIRFPRVLLSFIVGGGLAVVGVTLQALVRNPLADAYILGISSGASVGAVLAIGFGALAIYGTFAVSIAAFMGAALAFLIVYLLANISGRITPGSLVLAGIGIGYVFSGITSFITLTSDKRQLAGQVLAWTLGSLARATWFDLTLPSLTLLLITGYLLLQSRSLNAMIVSDETAVTLGIHVDSFRRQIFTLVALMTGVMVAVSGAIGFVGLMVPHIARFVVGSDHRKVLPISVLAGSIFLIWADVLARGFHTPIDAPIELPVGVVTSVLGGPFFLWLLWRTRLKRRMDDL